MRLIDFKNYKPLDRLRRRMGAPYIEWHGKDWKRRRREDILKELGTQVGIELDEELSGLNVEDDGTFVYEGERVLLYIRDQYYYANSPDREYKYHLCACSKIDEMFSSGRRNRYVVTKNTSGTFYVRITDRSTERVLHEGPREMRVCKLCLQKLSYKGYSSHGSSVSRSVYEGFDLSEFFELYSKSHFPEKPDYNEYTAPLNQYTDDFPEISRRYRAAQNWTCEECGVYMGRDKQWLHTHHRNHVKSDNSLYNLEALCLACHSSKPGHEGMRRSSGYSDFDRKYPNAGPPSSRGPLMP